MFAEPEFWVAVAFIILIGAFAYLGVHRTVLTALDHRRDRIKAELDDARRLKDEAATLLAEYKARHAKAEAEAQEIIAPAFCFELRCHHPRKRVTQYSREISVRAERPRRTGSPGQAGR